MITDRNYILHLLRVAKLTQSFCKIYFDDERMANYGFICGLTHDVGKLEIPPEILNKPGKLTTDEFEEIKQHSIYSYELLRLAGLNEYGRIALFHHEKFNGHGYPKGIQGEEIPLLSRIVAICDVFDAMTSKRDYKRKISTEDTIAYIENNLGQHFDPILAKYFVENIEKILFQNELEVYISA